MSQANRSHMMTETMAECLQLLNHTSKYWTVRQWVPDWRSTDVEGYRWQWKCCPQYRIVM